ncbi:MAG: proline dehydrogenase family protein [Nannocystaceae bacterium]
MISRLVPAAFVRWFARPYVAGHSIESVLRVAHRENCQHGHLTTIDLLGEAVEYATQVEENIRTYERLIERLAHDSRFPDPQTRPSLSLKPSAFTFGDRESASEPLARLIETAHANRVQTTIDMECRQWTDFTLDLSIGLFERGIDVGTVVQTRLHRTRSDLERFPAGMRVRLVIGIYNEPASAAITDKLRMKQRLVSYGKRLLQRGVHVEFASHDETFIARFVHEVAIHDPGKCEVQMLLGVPRDRCKHQLDEGAFGVRVPVRIYAPFSMGAEHATAYLRRRLDENPSIALLVLRNLLPSKRTGIASKGLPSASNTHSNQ